MFATILYKTTNAIMSTKQPFHPLFTANVAIDCNKPLRKFTYTIHFSEQNTYVNYIDNISNFSNGTDVENF